MSKLKEIFFPSPKDFREWLEKNHATETEVWVGYYKKSTKIKSMTWSESVDEAICFGWIDGIRKSIDDKSYTNRFTPRRPTSNWSSVNIEKVKMLKALGKMMPAGLAAYEKRKKSKSSIYSYEQELIAFSNKFEKKIQQNEQAWKYFNNLAPTYKKFSIHWLMSAKREATQIKRLNILIESCEQGLKIPTLRP